MKVAFLPKKATSPTQPLDAGIIKLWKVKRKGKLISPARSTDGKQRVKNCQVYQPASSYTMGETSLGFNQLPATASSLVITTPRTSLIYFLLKIHKPNNAGRLIVPACICPTELIYIHTYIQTLFYSSPLGALPPYRN